MTWSHKINLFVLVIAFFAAGCSVEKKVTTTGSQKKVKHYSNEQIHTLIVIPRLSTEKLVEMLGEPDFKGTGDQSDTFWQYYDLQKSDQEGETVNTNFIIDDGAVTYTWVTRTKDAYQDTED